MTTTPRPLDDDANYKLGEISGKIDLVLVSIAAQRGADEIRFTKLEACQDTQASEIAALQRDRSWVLGGAATITAALGTAFAWLGLR